MKQKYIDRGRSAGYSESPVRAGIARALAFGRMVIATEAPVEKKSLKLYFDNIVAGEPSQPVKNSELVEAASYGDVDRVKELVANGAEVHAGQDRPLQAAAANGHAEVVKFLLEQKADATAEDNEALIEAARSGYDDVVALLLDHGADVHARNNESLKLASEFHIQTPGSFNARRRTPSDGHAKTLELLRARTAQPA